MTTITKTKLYSETLLGDDDLVVSENKAIVVAPTPVKPATENNMLEFPVLNRETSNDRPIEQSNDRSHDRSNDRPHDRRPYTPDDYNYESEDNRRFDKRTFSPDYRQREPYRESRPKRNTKQKMNNHLYKTKACTNIINNGVCKRTYCNFAHNRDELRFPTCAYDTKCSVDSCTFKHSYQTDEDYIALFGPNKEAEKLLDVKYQPPPMTRQVAESFMGDVDGRILNNNPLTDEDMIEISKAIGVINTILNK